MEVENARALAEQRLDEMARRSDVTDLVLLDDQMEEHTFGFLFFYDSQAHLDSGDFRDALAGNGPLLVLHSGEVVSLPTYQPIELSLAANR